VIGKSAGNHVQETVFSAILLTVTKGEKLAWPEKQKTVVARAEMQLLHTCTWSTNTHVTHYTSLA